ncbi:predicted protein [Chaetomium globosum CBS 148.51]|uniref:F-box domain-containing protein n=1 Tax=Chaetomium globosum (strain ATCC 6205 / CBS 148.51 / DSM 1962 / NBRC 6347 / NRRL 1970) TaxID=306901 RepID=Q2H480_CHAGB|nr:uncharacterized protein CHGG_06535 [Chaetomium globosum CBS 148.51]EAQ89916.1 predicted protein [Chaetomium globosum CBS 148.51]
MLVRRGLRLMDRVIEAPMDALPSPYARRLQDIYSSHAPPGFEHVPDGMDFAGDFVLRQAASTLRQVPNLDSLHYHQCCDVTKSFSVSLSQATAGPPPLRNVTELILTDTFMTAVSFRNLLEAIGPKLSKVSIQGIETETESRRMSRNGKTVGFGEAVLALQPWKRELKVLRFTNDKMDLAPDACYLKGIHALRNLQALETIEAPTPSFDVYGQLGNQEDALTLTLPAFVRELQLPGLPEKVQMVPSLRGLARALRAGQFVTISPTQIHKWSPST